MTKIVIPSTIDLPVRISDLKGDLRWMTENRDKWQDAATQRHFRIVALEAERDAIAAAAIEAAKKRFKSLWTFDHDGYCVSRPAFVDLDEELSDMTPADASAALARKIREAEARGMREAAGICAAASDNRNRQCRDFPKKDHETRQRWMAGGLQARLLRDAILADAAEKEASHE